MQNLGMILADTARLHRKFYHGIFRSFGLHRGQHRLFFHMSETEGMTQTELADKMGITPATLTRMVQNLEKNGFLNRCPDPQDQRITRLVLTPRGREIRTEIKTRLREVDRIVYAPFSPEERETLAGMLRTVQEQLRRGMPPQGSGPCS